MNTTSNNKNNNNNKNSFSKENEEAMNTTIDLEIHTPYNKSKKKITVPLDITGEELQKKVSQEMKWMTSSTLLIDRGRIISPSERVTLRSAIQAHSSPSASLSSSSSSSLSFPHIIQNNNNKNNNYFFPQNSMFYFNEENNNEYNGYKVIKKPYVIVAVHLDTYCVKEETFSGDIRPGAVGHRMVKINDNELLCFGGGQLGSYTSHVHKMNLETKKWIQLKTSGNRPEARSEHSMVRFGNRVYVFGGRSGNQWYNAVYSLDLDNLEWRKEEIHGTPPSPRANQATEIVDDRMFIYGGYGPNFKVLNELYIFNFFSNTWVKPKCTGSPPPPLAGSSFSRVENTLYLFGGVDNYFTNAMFAFDTDRLKWKEVTGFHGMAPYPRCSHSCVSCGNKLVVFGGLTKNGQVLGGELHIFDTETWTWRVPHALPGSATLRSRCSHSATRMRRDCMVMLGGDTGGQLFSLEHVLLVNLSL